MLMLKLADTSPPSAGNEEYCRGQLIERFLEACKKEMVSCYLMYFPRIFHQAVVGLTCISDEEDVVRW